MEGLAFPDANFPGLISLTVSLLDTSDPVGQDGGRGEPRASRQRPSWGGAEPSGAGGGGRKGLGLAAVMASPLRLSLQELPNTLVFQDSVTFRVAPWIMTPNTQPAQEVYVCR